MEPNNVSYNPNKDPAAGQLMQYRKQHENDPPRNITNLTGRVIGSISNVLTAGPRGPMLLEDATYMEEQAHFNRERIPERVVHAKGAGAFGYFEVTNTEVTKYSSASLFSKLGKRTRIAVRFSTVIRERGSQDTVRDLRGFAIKFYTEEGIFDLVGLNTPTFWVRDPFMFMQFIHSQKRNPRTNLLDNNAHWDFFTLRPETLHQLTWMFSDKGIPDGFRMMDGWGSNTYKLVNADQKIYYNKFYFRSNQGVKNLDTETARQLLITDPDYAVHDLYDAIERKQYPSWTMFVQIMDEEQARAWEFNPFDVTKVWPEEQFPLIEVGRFTLNENPQNYFAEVEQISFNVSNRVRGIEFSPDKILQARIFAYADAARYRVGANYHLVPVNRPLHAFTPTQRDGAMNTSDNLGATPNYFPTSFQNTQDDPNFLEVRTHLEATAVDRYPSEHEDNYTQVRTLYRSFSAAERSRLHENIVSELQYTFDFIQKRAIEQFNKVDPEYGAGVEAALNEVQLKR